MAKTDWSTKTITLEDGTVKKLAYKGTSLVMYDKELEKRTIQPNTPIQIPLLEGTNTFFADSDVNLEVQYIKAEDATAEDTDSQTPTPNFPEEIESVGGEIVVSGKNLFNGGIILINDNRYFVTPSYSSTPCTTIKPNTDYTLSINVPCGIADDACVYLWKDGNNIDITNMDNQNVYIFNSGDADGISFYAKFTEGITDESSIKIQLEYGTEATPYEPYAGEPQTITIPKLNGIGDYKDILHVDRASQRMWVERKYKEIVLDGTENWKEHHTNKSSFYIQTPGGTFEFGSSKCDNFKFINSVWNTDKMGFSECYNDETFYIGMPGMNNTQFKQWLSENPTTVIYQLAEPTIEEVDYNEDLLTFYPTTVINVGELETEIKATMKQFK